MKDGECHHPTQVSVYDLSEPPVYQGTHCGSCGVMMNQPHTPVDENDPDERFIDEPQGDELATEDEPRRCASDCICDCIYHVVAVAPV